MNKTQEALKMAIEGMAKAEKVFDDLGLLLIKFGVNPSDINFHKESFLAPAIQSCKEALAELEQQPKVTGFIRTLETVDKDGIETWKLEPFFTLQSLQEHDNNLILELQKAKKGNYNGI